MGKKVFLGFLLFLIILLILFNQNIPAFIYNEMEYKIRTKYYEVERVREAINIMIGIRGGLTEYLITDQKKS